MRAIRLKIATLHHELHKHPMPKPPAPPKIVPEWLQQPRVTDHALIRYIERELGVSLDPVRKEILSHQVIEAMKIEDEQFVLGRQPLARHQGPPRRHLPGVWDGGR